MKIISAENFGDTPQQKTAIRQLVGDGANIAGLVAGANFLKYRVNNLPSFGSVAGEVGEAEVGAVQSKSIIAKEMPINAHNLERLNTQLIAEQIAKGHAFDKHILTQGEFSGLEIRTYAHLQSHIEMILTHPVTETINLRDRTVYIHRPSHTVIVHNPKTSDRGTILSVL